MWTQQETQRFNSLAQKVGEFQTQVTILMTECDTQPYYSQHSMEYNPDTIVSILNDKFPSTACLNEKGILFMNDYIVFTWKHETDGWIEYDKIIR